MQLLVAVVVLVVVAAEAAVLPMSDPRWQKPVLRQELIDQINNDPTSTWKAGVNSKFAHMRLADVKSLMGALPGGPKLPAAEHRRRLHDAQLPAEFDWRNASVAAKCPSLTEVRDQSACGSCWAVAAAEAMTDRICIASNGATNFHVSAADLVACCNGSFWDDGCGGFGCNGGFASGAWTYWKNQGLHSGGNYEETATTSNGCFPYPFQPCAHHTNSSKYPSCDYYDFYNSPPSCPMKCSDSESWSTDVNKADSVYSVDLNENAIAAEIYNYGPVEASYLVYDDFFAYKSGVYSRTSDTEVGGHGVKILGWGTESGVAYWLVANSWNDDWGDHGYFKIKKGTNECMIEEMGIYAGRPKST